VSARLRTENLSVSYGGNLALDAVSLQVGDGELVGLIGPNGAGKTTFIDALSGFTRCTGRVWVGGTEVTGVKPHLRVGHGLGRTWQGAELYDDLTVRENLEVAGGTRSVPALLRQTLGGRRTPARSIGPIGELLGIGDILDRRPEDLSPGRRKLVDIGRALAAGSRVLCLDEPAAGLDSHESLRLGGILRKVVAQGTSLLLVDHDMGLVLGVCDRIVVLDLGRVIAEGTAEEIRESPQVIEAYLGADAVDGLDGAGEIEKAGEIEGEAAR
jgi:branched-chain amino acid transport system ATP-binding protein